MKIAIIGSAPSSVKLAPYKDPSWRIWSCSPGAWPNVERCDAHFELHRWQPAPWFSKEYIEWMSKHPKVYMIRPVPELPNSVAYPKEEMLARFGPWFFASTVSWMLALAIAEGATEISLWGVDMSATSEWIYQRSGCHYFIDLAKRMGIKVMAPFESDLLRPPPLYGYCEEDPFNIKLMARKEELGARLADATRREAVAHDERLYLQGAIEDVEYSLKTWVSDRMAMDMAYAQPQWIANAPAPSQIEDEPPFIPNEVPEIIEPQKKPRRKYTKRKKTMNGRAEQRV